MKHEELIKKAEEVSKNAYSEYSKFSVGACVLAKSGKTYVGCNMENASYGLTICAERNAIANAVANGEREILAVAIFSPNMENCFPCGACRQVIFEFQGENPIEIITKKDGKIKIKRINELLPEGFNL